MDDTDSGALLATLRRDLVAAQHHVQALVAALAPFAQLYDEDMAAAPALEVTVWEHCLDY